MALNEPIGRQVARKVDAYRGNPQGLQQRYQQNQQLLDLLALQKLKTEKDAARNSLALAQTQNSKTMLQQLEGEHVKRNKDEMVEQAGGVMQQQQAKQQSNLQRTAQGAVPSPQAAAQGATPPPNVANTGIAAASRAPMRMAQGGVVGFQSGGGISDEEIAKASGMSLADFLGLDSSIQEKYRSAVTQEADPKSTGLQRFLAQQKRNLANLRQQGITAGEQRTGADRVWDWLTKDAEERAAAEEQGRVVGSPHRQGLRKSIFGEGSGQLGMLGAARRGQTEVPIRGVDPASAPMGTTQGGVGGGQWGGPMTKEQAFPPSPPTGAEVDVPAEGPQLTPLQIKQKQAEGAGTLPGGLGQLSPADIAASQREKSDVVQAQRSGLLTNAATRARNLADTDPAAQRKSMWDWMQQKTGITPTEETAEAGMQSDLAKLLYARQRAGEGAGNRAYLSNMARGDISAASDARQAVRDKQMEQGIAGVREIQGQKRTFSGLKRAANAKAATAATKAYEIAGEMKRSGVTAMSTIGEKDQNRLNDHAKAINTMEEGNIKRSWEASVHNASQEVKVAVANATAEIAEARLDIDVEMKLLAAGQLSEAKKEKLLADIQKNMSSARSKILEIYAKAKKDILVKDAKAAKAQEEELDRQMNIQLHIQLKPMNENMKRVQSDLGHLKVTKQ